MFALTYRTRFSCALLCITVGCPLSLHSHLSTDFQLECLVGYWGCGLGLKKNIGHISLFFSASSENVTAVMFHPCFSSCPAGAPWLQGKPWTSVGCTNTTFFFCPFSLEVMSLSALISTGLPHYSCLLLAFSFPSLNSFNF
uniref:Secreted protein n=1 Tax=Molossus molossus TaxID=27622 RepID=A0A7J8JVG6_MOLMO|nr:hypothetical protein HJG59_007892 [Molossus molossus]